MNFFGQKYLAEMKIPSVTTRKSTSKSSVLDFCYISEQSEMKKKRKKLKQKTNTSFQQSANSHKMEDMQESLQWWRDFQKIYGPVGIAVITAIMTGIMLIVSQRQINKKERLMRAHEQAQELLDQKKRALSGTISKQNNIQANTVTVRFGQSTAAVDIQLLRNGYILEPFAAIGGNNISVKLKNEVILISAEFKSFDGRIVANIVDNEWQINPNNYFDRNYDDNGLEVIDQDLITKFQIDYRDIYNIRIGGSFLSDNAFYVFPSHGTSLVSGLSGEKKENLVKMGKKVKTLFSYPSANHFGERAKN